MSRSHDRKWSFYHYYRFGGGKLEAEDGGDIY